MNKQKLASFQWKVSKEHDGILLRSFLREIHHISKRSLVQIKFGGGRILVNGEVTTVRTILREHDNVAVYLPTERVSNTMQPEHQQLDLVYEDEHLLVVNKQAGTATIPSREHPKGTLANLILGYYEQRKIAATFHAVNRLDKDTSGLLIVAKHRHAHATLSRLLKSKGLERQYTAICAGVIEPSAGIIDEPIGRKSTSVIEREVREDGMRAITHYQVTAKARNASLLSIQLETGRTHQIRVHFAFLGHPLIGDDLYGGKKELIQRQALHCDKLSFTHPFTGELIECKAELPSDMLLLKQTLNLNEQM